MGATRIVRASILAVLAVAVFSPVSAAPLTWDATLNGNWDTTTANWNAGAAMFADNDDVTFDDTASGTHSVSIVGTVSPLSVTVDTGSSYTLSNGTGTGTLAGTSGGLVKNGTGTLILGPTNTYTGSTLVNAGTLQLTAQSPTSASLGSTSGVTVVSGAALDLKGAKLSSAKTVTIAGAGPTGAGALVNTGSSVADYGLSVILSADATVGGTGRWDIGWGGTTLNGAGFALTKTGSGYLDIRGAVSNLAALNVNQGYLYFETSESGMGSTVMTVNPGAAVGIYANPTVNTQIVLNGGTIGQFGNNNTHTGTWSGPVTVAANSTISSQAASAWGGGNVVMSGAISGTANLAVAGPHIVTLSGDNSGYSGAISVQSGILKAGSTTALGVGGVTVASGATLDTNGQNFVDASRPNITIAGTGTTGQGALICNTGYSDIGALTLTADAKINVGGRLDTFGAISGAGFTLTKTGTGECMAIRGGVTDLAGLVVEQGRVRFEDTAFGSWTGPVTVKTGGTLSRWATGSTNVNVILDGGTMEDEFNGTATWNGTVTVNSDSFIAKNSGSMVLNGAISGAGKITSAGGNTATVNADNAGFTGAWNLTGGILRLGNANAMGNTSGVTVASGATVDFVGLNITNQRNYTIAGTGASGQNGVLVNSGSTARIQNLALTADAKIHNNGRMDIFGPISGNYVLTKTGTGECLAIRGGVTDLGGLVIEQGKVRLENTALGSWAGPVTVKTGSILTHWTTGSNSAAIILDGGTLADENNGTATFNGPVAVNSNSFVSTGGGNVVLNGALSGTGGLTIYGGATATINTSGTVGSLGGNSKLALGSGAVLTTGANGATTSYTGLISGAGGLAKTGAGTMTVSELGNTYGGGTVVNQGTLVSFGPGSLGTGPVTLDGGTLVLSGGQAVSGFGGNGAGWTLNGGATVAADVATITTAGGSQARSVFCNSVVPVNSFGMNFTYSASDKTTGDPADGLVIVLQSDPRGPAALAASGGARGYSGTGVITPSAGIGFNLYPPGTPGISNNVYINGSTGGGNTSVSPVVIYGTPFDVQLTYDYGAKTLTALLTQGANTFTRVYTGVDLPAVLGGAAYVGFTGGTGGANAVQTVSNFSFVSAPATTATTFVNDLAVSGGTVGNLAVGAAAGTSDFSMGNLAMGSGATLSLAAAGGSAADIDYSLTLGATSLAGPAAFAVANNGTGTGTLELGAVSGGAAASLTKNGPGTLVLSGANSYQGDTTVADGTLALVTGGTNNIASSPTVDVRGGAVLDVTGVAGGFTLDPAQYLKGNGTVVGNVTGSAGSMLSAGSSPGTLTIVGDYVQGGGTLLAELAGYDQGAATATGYDWILVNGEATLGGVIAVDLINGFLPYEGAVFTILTATNGITNVDFSGIEFDFDYGPDGTYSYAPRFVETQDGVSLQLQVVPEPITLTLLGLAATGLGGYIRRRR
ncbi:MAG: Autotransporter-associated beta strand repeat protein [Planctomycetes bacterium ADurb.Bin126]|nr:MAG: Autotransporter-associated beta strand repeat protein [Planctomycetes bacterium ADurb.Bin126]HOD80667.1 autotransporter-associated beta strand repeat-containing protein [Phycisphaerae bacterium]HQL73887.1 autotransporter-associated beta strand repeat-containing protein [Phycisphaerae bacterium]